MKTTLYRFWNQDELLYVGISLNVFARLSQHRRDKDWWDEITNITVSHFDTREQALDAEAKAIKEENPMYNIAMNNGVHVQLDRDSEVARLEAECVNMHLSLEKLGESELDRKYDFLPKYDMSLNNPKDVLKLATELANMDYAIEQAREIAKKNLEKYIEDVVYGEQSVTS